jgi:hypothetical protein
VPRWTDRSKIEPQGTPFRTLNLAGAFLEAGYEVVFFDQSTTSTAPIGVPSSRPTSAIAWPRSSG